MTDLFEPYATLRRLNEQLSMSPRPWSLIWDEGPAVNFTTGKPQGTCMKPDTLRIVDAENRLLVHIGSAPEQALKPEDMQLIVGAVNSLSQILDEADKFIESNDRLHDAINEARVMLQPGDGTIIEDRDTVIRAVIALRTATGEMP